ncbi:MAG: aquaporin Z [Leptolyngbyaceae cyanobacterium]
MPLTKKLIAEFIGTFWLVFGGCGSAVFAAGFLSGDNTFPFGIGFIGVALAFGLTVLTMAYAVGHISGGHFNPAVSFGLWAGGRFPSGELLPYIIAQVVGAIVAAGLIYLIAIGQPGFELTGSNPLATNGYGAHSPGGYNLLSCLIAEVVLTFIFLFVILGATDRRAPAGFGPIAIGMALTLIHLISIPITNTSVNPARSLGPALFAGGALLGQVWLFWVAPILGAVLAGFAYSSLMEEPSVKTTAPD